MLNEIKKAIDNYLERINKIIGQSLPESNGSHSSLHEAMRYSTLNGGKRIRPLLIYSCGECLKIEKEKSLWIFTLIGSVYVMFPHLEG